MAFDIYAEVTAKIVAMLEAGVVPWRNPILGQNKAGRGSWPKNLETVREYRGVNVFLLAMTSWCKGYESSYWLTFNQAKARGGMVRKGEKSSMVVFWKAYDTVDKTTGEAVTVPVLRYYNVFNVEQCEGIMAPDAQPIETSVFSPIEAAEQIVGGYEGRPEIVQEGLSGRRAFYVPATDAVHLPPPSRFLSPEAYYATLFHELAHSTGHSKRLDRGIDTTLAPFGSSDYAREELIAEMAAAFLCGQTGIAPATLDNAASYIAGWIKALKGDKRLAISAGGAAQRAADWIRGNRGTGEGAAVPSDPGPEVSEATRAAESAVMAA